MYNMDRMSYIYIYITCIIGLVYTVKFLNNNSATIRSACKHFKHNYLLACERGSN